MEVGGRHVERLTVRAIGRGSGREKEEEGEEEVVVRSGDGSGGSRHHLTRRNASATGALS